MNTKKMVIYGILLTIAAVGQIILAVFLYDPEANALVINLGWGVLMLSAIFGWLPIFTFRRRGQVQGRGYMRTTVLVDSGIYGIVRHPQYLAGILMNIALSLMATHWSVIALGIVAAIINYLNTYDEERSCIEKFGEDYLRYKQKVPRLNFVLGIIRAIRRTREST